MTIHTTDEGLIHHRTVVGNARGRQRGTMLTWKGLSAGQRARQLEIELLLLNLEITAHRAAYKTLRVAYWLYRKDYPVEVQKEIKAEMFVRKKLVTNLHAAIMYRQDRIKVWRNRTY